MKFSACALGTNLQNWLQSGWREMGAGDGGWEGGGSVVGERGWMGGGGRLGGEGF